MAEFLIVDDDPSVRDLFQTLMEVWDLPAVVVSSGYEAMRVLRRDPDVRLILTDILMPGMGGRELALRARAWRQGLTIVAMSGEWDGDEESLPVDQYIRKPFDLETVHALFDPVPTAPAV